MPDALSLSRSELPEEIATAIEELMRQSRGWYCVPEAHEVIQARETLTAAILFRLGEAQTQIRTQAMEQLAADAGWELDWDRVRAERDALTAKVLEMQPALTAALARVERLEKELADIKAAEAAEAERIAAEQHANSIAYLQANIAQMERFMERGEEADPIGYMQWRSRRDRFQQELDAALTEAGCLAIQDA